MKESVRIQGVLNELGPGFALDGVIRTVLRNRIKQEKRRERRKQRSNDTRR